MMFKKNDVKDDGYIAEAQPIPGSSEGKDKDVKGRGIRLSFVSAQYDIDGDGQLDEAELAMRNLDKSGRGFLTNEKVYQLMTEQLAMQAKIFQFKKIIIGLSAFVFVLTLSNLATSFASAILAKDTASEGGFLVDKGTHEAVATSQAVQMYDIVHQEGDSEDERRLRELQVGIPGKLYTTVLAADALGMLLQCSKGKEIVELTYATQGTDTTTNTKVTICGSGSCGSRPSSFTMKSNGVSCLASNDPDCLPVAGALCTESDAKIIDIKPQPGTGFYTIAHQPVTIADPNWDGVGDGLILPPPPIAT